MPLETPNDGRLNISADFNLLSQQSKDAIATAGISAPFRHVTTPTYNIQASDNGRIITLKNASGVTVTIPAGIGDSNGNFACLICQESPSGVCSVVAGGGVGLHNRQGQFNLAGDWASVSLVAVDVDLYILAGDTA